MAPLFDALLAAPRPRAVFDWLYHNHKVSDALGRMASGGLPLSHGALDSLEPMLGLRAYRHLGNLLMATGALPVRDSVLAALERWCDRELAAIDHPEHARILRAYRTIIVCLATACLHDEDGLRQADARVQQGVDGVDRDVGDDDEPGGEDHHPLDHWQVLVGDALHHRATESGQAEHALGDDGATEDGGDVDAELGDDRGRRAAGPGPPPAARSNPWRGRCGCSPRRGSRAASCASSGSTPPR